MKTLILFLFPTLLFSQEYYEGEGKVVFQNEIYSTIVFGRNGHSPTTFIVKNNEIKEGKSYQFYLKKVSFKGSKETAKVLFFHLSKRQIVIERRRILDSINQNFTWI